MKMEEKNYFSFWKNYIFDMKSSKLINYSNRHVWKLPLYSGRGLKESYYYYHSTFSGLAIIIFIFLSAIF
jgi:hypothetical protein